LHNRALIIAVFLIASTSLSAKMQTDSLILSFLPLTGKPVALSIQAERMNIDPLNGLYSFTNRGRDYYEINSHELILYNNLRDVAQRRYITRWLHEFIVKKQVAARQQVMQPRRSENEFEEYKGLIIRNISFSSTSLLAPSIDDPVYHSPERLERIGMFLHVNTNQRVIKNNLLFKPGDKIDPFLFGDNERILRQLSYLEDARIYILEDKLNPGHADIVVVTKDRLSKGLDIDMHEIDEGRVELYDRNLFGWGQELQTNIYFNGGSDKLFGYGTRLRINNIRGNFINAGISYLDVYENNTIRINADRNFLTPSMKYAGGLDFTSSRLIDNFIFPDTSFYNHKLNYHEYDLWFGRSFLLPLKNSYNRRNIYITSRFNRNIHFERPEIDEKTRYEFHNRSLFLVNLTLIQLGYLKSNYIYGFGPTEDIPVGTRLEATLGYETNQFSPRLYSGFRITRSNYLQNRVYLNNSISLGGFLNEGVYEQGVLRLETSGFSKLMDLNRFYLRQFFTLNFTHGIARFEDEMISISNRYGIRGLRSDALRGTKKLTLQTETMLYAKNNWYGFRYALFAMADLGWIGDDRRPILNDSFYSGFGIGMRMRNEHLVFPTLQFRFAYFPRLPESASARLFYLMSERSHIPDEFKIGAPDILPYR
jgi:hypothetical protein